MEGSRIAWDRKTTLPLALLYFSLFRISWSISAPYVATVSPAGRQAHQHISTGGSLWWHMPPWRSTARVSSFHHEHASSIPHALLPLRQQPPHPPPGPTSFPYKLPLPWQLAKRGHYPGDVSDRRWKAGRRPSALHQRTSGFRREHCACLLHMHKVSVSCSVSQRQIICFRLPVIVHARQVSFTYHPVCIWTLALITLSSCGHLANIWHLQIYYCCIHTELPYPHSTTKYDTAWSGGMEGSLYLQGLSSRCSV